MPKLKTIEEEWNDFSAMIFAKLHPSEVQVKETKQAFFAGAFAMVTAMDIVGGDDVSEAQGMQYFEDRRAEGIAFYKDLIKRYAEGN